MGFKGRGATGDRDRLAEEAIGLGPDDERAPAVAAGLARRFFEPREAHVALDIERAQSILIGGGGLPALSGGDDPWRWGPWDRPRHIAVPEGVVHPAARSLWARKLGWTTPQIEALLAAEIYLGERGEPRLWPWYREQDRELRESAAARAAQLDVGLPERMLDEPFESGWYWRRSGREALAALASRRGLEVSDVEVRVVPVLELGARIEWEGGGRAPNLATQQARVIADLAGRIEQVSDPDYQGAMRAALQRALDAYIAAVRGVPPPHLAIPPLEVAGAAGAFSDQKPSNVTLREIWAIDGGAAIAADGVLVTVDEDGKVRAAWSCPVVPWLCSGRLAMVNDGEQHALDLFTGEWITASIDPVETFGGALFPVATDLGFSDDESPLSPDGRYRLHLDHGVQRMGDGIWVAGDALFGGWYDDGDDEEVAEPAPALFDPTTIEIAGVTVTSIDGVTFTSRRRQSYEVRGDETPVAFVLAGDRWRALIDRSLRINDREVARLPLACHAAAFSRPGRRLWVLTTDHLLRIDWKDEPRLAASLPLEPIAAAAREVLG